MNYTKPEITSLASASTVIQGQIKSIIGMDGNHQPFESIAAYEGDE
jgi:hypothetical protein